MSIFTRRHYIWLERQFALALYDHPLATDRDVIWETINHFADNLERQSSLFDKKLFIEEIRSSFLNLSTNPDLHDFSSTSSDGYVK